MTELYHHGIKGQRWGVRRYQNKNGALTSAGKKRYAPTNGDVRKAYDIDHDEAGVYGNTAEKFYDKFAQNYDEKYNKLAKKMYERKEAALNDEKMKSEAEKKYDSVKKQYIEARNKMYKGKTFKERKEGRREADKLLFAFREADNTVSKDGETKRLRAEREKAAARIVDQYSNKMASALLQRYGYNDDAESRKFVRKYLIDERDW